MRRFAAALVAIVCWVGLVIQFMVTFGRVQDVPTALWVLARFFTIITNLLVAGTMTWVAAGGRPKPVLIGGLTLSLLLVGIVYATLLEGLEHLTGPALSADILLHKVSPVLLTLWWLVFAPARRLNRSAPLWWAAYPLAYFAYAQIRGQVDGRYPYPFMDLGKLGWIQTLLNAGGIALAFVVAGFLLVWIDSWRPLGSKRSRR